MSPPVRLTENLENDPGCPWLEVARLKLPGAYVGKVKDLRTRLRTDATQDELAMLFYGRRDRHPPDGASQEAVDAWTSAMNGLTVLLDQCCELLDSEAPLYNSAKHGLSAVPGNAAVQFGEPTDPIVTADGPSVTLLEAATDTVVGRKRCRQTTHWISADRRLAFTYLVIQQIENVWTVARHRYLVLEGSTRLAPLPHDKIDQLLNPPPAQDGPGYTISVASMGMGLLYESDNPSIKLRLEAASRKNRKRR